jgi:mRNA-degrading endonuclease HigB of HigAB toxin-antitoxin module
MRVITARALVEAMKKHGQWKAGLKLWLDVFNTPPYASSLYFSCARPDPLKEVNHENNDVKRQPA